MCWPIRKTATTSRNQPSTAVLRWRTLQPAIRSTTGRAGPRDRERSGSPVLGGVVLGNTELCDGRIVGSPGFYGATLLRLALARECQLPGKGIGLIAGWGTWGRADLGWSARPWPRPAGRRAAGAWPWPRGRASARWPRPRS